MIRFAEYLRDRYSPWIWMGQRAHDAWGVNKILPLDMIISCDYGAEIPYYFDPEKVFSVERREGLRKDWSNDHLSDALKGDLGAQVFKKWSAEGERANLVCYRSVKRVEKATGPLHRRPRIFAASEYLKRKFDDKILFYGMLDELGLPRGLGSVDSPGNVSFEDLRKDLGLPFVVQFPYGSSGLYTFIVREEAEYERLRRDYPDKRAVMREYIEGFSLNVNAIIVDSTSEPRTFCTFPSIQLTGIEECSNFDSAFCGNDFTAAKYLDRSIIEGVEEGVKAVGRWMARHGYRGIFGMDFVVRDGKTYPMEINPRFQNSTSLLNAVQASNVASDDALVLLHIAQFMIKEDETARSYVMSFPFHTLMDPIDGCQVILHNRMTKSIVYGSLTPGVYGGDDRSLNFIKEGAGIGECERDSDALITCGVPQKGMPIEPNAPLCKVQTKRSLVSSHDKMRLAEEGVHIVRSVYDKLALRSADEIDKEKVGIA